MIAVLIHVPVPFEKRDPYSKCSLIILEGPKKPDSAGTILIQEDRYFLVLQANGSLVEITEKAFKQWMRITSKGVDEFSWWGYYDCMLLTASSVTHCFSRG